MFTKQIKEIVGLFRIFVMLQNLSVGFEEEDVVGFSEYRRVVFQRDGSDERPVARMLFVPRN